MARLNNRPSTAANSRAQSSAGTSPAPVQSDQENRDPVRPRDKGKGRAMDDSRGGLPTPSSDGTENVRGQNVRGQKRKRAAAHPSATQPDDIAEDEDPESLRFTRYYDPNQDADARREVKRKSRTIQRDFNENRDDYLRGDNAGLKETIDRANQNFKRVKQTGDATVDARLLVDISTTVKRKAASMVLGDTNAGLDVDLFLGKCISYMKHGGPVGATGPTQTQARGRRTRDAEDSEEEDDTELDWETLGRMACFPYNSRPVCPSFLLGPLSVEKKVRQQTQRRARQRLDNTQQKQPEKLERGDMNAKDQNALTSICVEIKDLLKSTTKAALRAVKAIKAEEEPLGLWSAEREKEVRKEHRLDPEMDGPSLFDFVVNPRSFGQTVENMFYVSFLIKEGNVGVVKSANGMPTLLRVVQPDQEGERVRDKGVIKKQSIFSLDYATWQKLVQAFDITEPMIPHREEVQPTQVGSRGWYA